VSVIETPSAAADGAERVAWTRSNMPLLAALREEFARERPLEEHRLGMCLHVEPKTAVLVEVLVAGGCAVTITGSPATTDDGTAAALDADGVTVYARAADDARDHAVHIGRVLDSGPDCLLDNGADLIAGAVARGLDVDFATEETTSGANRLKEEFAGEVPFPVVVIDDSPLKRLIENTYGVGPTVVEGFMRPPFEGAASSVGGTSRFPRTPSTGPLSRTGGCAAGATVIAVEVDPVRALEAAFEGMRVLSLDRALAEADVVITVTGRTGIVGPRELRLMRDGAILANAGHFSELVVDGLPRRRVAPGVEELTVGARTLRLLGRGEMLNLTGATGNQIQVMDLGFALQAHSLRALARDPAAFAPGPQPVPREIDEAVGRAMLASLPATR
jgi:adenosylhomocysteinase